MGLFKKKTEPVVPARKCPHKWKDFDWYLETNIQNNPYGKYEYSIRIYEPYVCLLCKERQNKQLENISGSTYEKKTFFKQVQAIKEQYAEHLRDRAVIEDQIQDTLMNIDRIYLEIWEKVKNGGLENGRNINDNSKGKSI